jgi:hypothetical protein
MELGGLLNSVHAHGFGQDLLKEACGIEQFKSATGVAFSQHQGEFVADALAADLADPGGGVADGDEGARFDFEVEARGEADGSQHAQLVFGEAQGGIPDRAENLSGEIVAAADEVERCGGGVAGGFKGNVPLMVKSRRRTSSRASVENWTASGRRPSL